jgi:transposase
MYHIRTTKTASGATAVQVVEYIQRKLKLVVHVGSAHTKEDLRALKEAAQDWIERRTKQAPLFPKPRIPTGQVFTTNTIEYLGIRYLFIYEIFHGLLSKFYFHTLNSPLLSDLVIMRLVEPVSKSQSLELLQEYFDIHYLRKYFYQALPTFVQLKDRVEKLVLKRAVANFNFDFSLVFYDVTTLYFESFEPDELRKPGFSKDNKSNQPQIVIGLVVSNQGFPVAYEVFEGNKFEGKTLIPVIQNFKQKHGVKQLTVVADAAMISLTNITALKEQGLSYIVGARVANLSPKKIPEISQRLSQRDGNTMRMATEYGDLICSFSSRRYNKDKREMEKQTQKAENFIADPSSLKRTKFLKTIGPAYSLNQELIEKTKLLLGIKGYYTNLPQEIMNDSAIISHYQNLWHVEQAFRIAKSDLRTRPIFHHKSDAIKVHLLICFMALAVSKYIELKTGQSIHSVIKLFKRVTDARLLNTLTKEEIVLRSKIPDTVTELLEKLSY